MLEVLAIIGHNRADPILLTAVCTFALDVFETDEIVKDSDFMKPFFEVIMNLIELMPYLGVSNEKMPINKYSLLLQMTRAYQREVDHG